MQQPNGVERNRNEKKEGQKDTGQVGLIVKWIGQSEIKGPEHFAQITGIGEECVSDT
jgi:hypothetical protein